MRWLVKTAGVVLSLLVIAGCTPNISPTHYNVDTIGQAQTASPGVITQATPVQVSANHGSMGTLVGGSAGAVAGSAIGGGVRANLLGGIGGAVAGGLLGNAVGSRVGNQTGMQYIVHLDSGKILSVVQGGQVPLAVGQRVLVLSGGSANARIIPDNSPR